MDDVWGVAFWAGMGKALSVAADVADEGKGVGMEGEGKETFWAEGLPAAFFTESERGGTTTIGKDESLVVILEIGLDGAKELVGKIAAFGEIFPLFEVDDFDIWGNSSVFGLGGEGDDGLAFVSNVIIGD